MAFRCDVLRMNRYVISINSLNANTARTGNGVSIYRGIEDEAEQYRKREDVSNNCDDDLLIPAGKAGLFMATVVFVCGTLRNRLDA